MKRVVLDTNVTISALFWKGHPGTIYDLIRGGQLTMHLSNDMEKEFIRVLGNLQWTRRKRYGSKENR